MRAVLVRKLVLSLLIVVAMVTLVIVGVRGELRDRGERRGTVTVADCTFLTYGRHGDSYRCGGSFASADGALLVPYVTFVNTGELKAGERLAATVSGPDDDTASPLSEGRYRLLVTGGGTIGLFIVLVALWRATRRRKGQGPAPTR